MRIELIHSTLRPWTRDDAESLAKYANERDIWLHLRDFFPHPYTLQDARDYLERVSDVSPAVSLAIEVEGEACGGISASVQSDVHRFTAEIGYWLGKPFWRQRITTEAVGAFTEYLFSTFQLHRVFAVPYANNPASERTLEKNGFIREGRMKQSVVKDGDILDQLIYAITSQQAEQGSGDNGLCRAML
ncbi:GNAT family N-acetyltransferase [Cerasicoccus frondis]|uniref:GNAT family N-acetyltransferase n=1 Tax=Cerasicoccus frondis TaxID=490090 RepID=UPI002852CA22|nr:GNAT family N-acetyltransferase [Cerasicoccus frondis]